MKRSILLVLLACREPAPPPPPQPRVVGPENVAVVEREVIRSGPRISGSLGAEEIASVRAEASGAVAAVRAEVGDRVRTGQLLARIEEKSLRQQMASAQSSLRTAREELALAERQAQRTRRLVKVGALAERDLELAEAEVVAARARMQEARTAIALARQELGATVVRSPIDGVVSERAVSEGDVVSSGAELFTIIDPSSMRLVASVPSTELGSIELGQEVEFQVRGYPERTFTGVLERIAPAVDPATRQIEVYAAIPNVEGALLAGLFAEGRILTRSHRGLVVPSAAVDLEGPVPTVLRVQNGRVEEVEVEIGIRDPKTERIELTSGVEEGDVLLLEAARVAPGTEVVLPEPRDRV